MRFSLIRSRHHQALRHTCACKRSHNDEAALFAFAKTVSTLGCEEDTDKERGLILPVSFDCWLPLAAQSQHARFWMLARRSMHSALMAALHCILLPMVDGRGGGYGGAHLE